MRRHDKEITDEKIIHNILEKSDICRLGLIDEGEAYIVPVNYAYEDGHIYIHSAPHGRKIDILKKNKNVSFEIEDSYEIIKDQVPCRWTAKYRSLMGKGVVTIENEPELKKRGLDKIMKKYGAKMDLVYDESSLSRIVILKLNIRSVSGKQSGEW